MTYFIQSQNPVPDKEPSASYDSSHYSFLQTHTMGISILPEYLLTLRNFAQNQWDPFLKYLYFKYHKKILALKQAPHKKTATAIYQPETKRYKNVKLKGVSPYVWDKYWDLRKITGYSISFIIRIFLEWEMEFIERAKEMEEKRLWEKYTAEGVNKCLYSSFSFRNSYSVSKWGSSERNDVKIEFRDEFY
ncbi:MAG: hypothetical protein ACK4UJ_03405 [Leptonema sp. (in: bacteria)]